MANDLNVKSGPDTYPPDANYIASVSKFNRCPNAVVLGYVNTRFTQVPYSALKSQVDTWAKWSTYTGANIAIHAIFLPYTPSVLAHFFLVSSVFLHDETMTKLQGA